MPQLSDVSLMLLPGSEQGLAQAEVSCEANFTKQELNQKQPYALSIALFAVYDESDLPEPAIGYFSNDPHQLAQAYPQHPSAGLGQSPTTGMPPPRHAQFPMGPTAHPGAGWAQAPGYLNAGRPYWTGPAYGAPHAPSGFGRSAGVPYAPANGYGAMGPGQESAYAAWNAPASDPHFGPRPGSNVSGYPTGYANGYPNGYAQGMPQGYPKAPGVGAHTRAAAHQPHAPEWGHAVERRSAERFLFWVCRELLLPGTAPVALQRRVLFDSYTFLADTPLMRAYVWLLPERTEGRSWSNLAQIPRAA